MRATRHDPQLPHVQSLTKTINSSPSVSSPPSSPVLVTPQAVVPRRSLALLLPSTLHPRTRPTSFSTSPTPYQKEQGKSVTRVVGGQMHCSHTSHRTHTDESFSHTGNSSRKARRRKPSTRFWTPGHSYNSKVRQKSYGNYESKPSRVYIYSAPMSLSTRAASPRWGCRLN